MSRILKELLLVGHVALFAVTLSEFAFADDNSVFLTIDLNAEIDELLAPRIYAQGEMIGLLPGTVSIQMEERGVVIEIGVPNLNFTPIYSMVIDQSSLAEKSVVVTQSVFSLYESYDVSWKTARLEPNRRETLSLAVIGENHYALTLSPDPYLRFENVMRRLKAEPYSENWYAKISAENDQSMTAGYEHMVFDSEAGRAVLISTTRGTGFGGETSWSGSTPFIESPFPRQLWKVISMPDDAMGADVHAEEGYIGVTEVSEELAMSQSFFISVSKAGFAQAIYCVQPSCKNRNCIKEVEGGTSKLTCSLQKVP